MHAKQFKGADGQTQHKHKTQGAHKGGNETTRQTDATVIKPLDDFHRKQINHVQKKAHFTTNIQ